MATVSAYSTLNKSGCRIFDKSEVYNGLPVDFEVAKPGGVTSVKYEYEGKGDTAYAKSETAPANVGNYTVTASFTMVDGCTQIALSAQR